jgi:hypothetical protein
VGTNTPGDYRGIIHRLFSRFKFTTYRNCLGLLGRPTTLRQWYALSPFDYNVATADQRSVSQYVNVLLSTGRPRGLFFVWPLDGSIRDQYWWNYHRLVPDGKWSRSKNPLPVWNVLYVHLLDHHRRSIAHPGDSGGLGLGYNVTLLVCRLPIFGMSLVSFVLPKRPLRRCRSEVYVMRSYRRSLLDGYWSNRSTSEERYIVSSVSSKGQSPLTCSTRLPGTGRAKPGKFSAVSIFTVYWDSGSSGRVLMLYVWSGSTSDYLNLLVYLMLSSIRSVIQFGSCKFSLTI